MVTSGHFPNTKMTLIEDRGILHLQTKIKILFFKKIAAVMIFNTYPDLFCKMKHTQKV